MVVPSLEAFLKKKQGAKAKVTNLNKEPTEDKEVKKSLKVDEKEKEWNDDVAEVKAIKVGLELGQVVKEESESEEEDNAPAWGRVKKETEANVNDKKFPSLAKAGSVLSATLIMNEHQASSKKVETHKNKFDNLASDEEEEAGEKRIGDAKKRGVLEASKVAKADKPEGDEANPKQKSSREQFLDDEAAKLKAQKKAERDALKAQIKASLKGEVAPAAPAAEVEEKKVEIKADEAAIAAKYEGRRKLPRVDLPAEEIACC